MVWFQTSVNVCPDVKATQLLFECMVWFLQDQDPLLSGAPFKGRLMSLEGGTYGGFPIKFLVLVVRHGLCLCCLCAWDCLAPDACIGVHLYTHCMHWCAPIHPPHALVCTCTPTACIGVHLYTHYMHWCAPVHPLHALVCTCISTTCIGVHLYAHCMHWCAPVCPLYALVSTCAPAVCTGVHLHTHCMQ